MWAAVVVLWQLVQASMSALAVVVTLVAKESRLVVAWL
jgi:hypothetical protein